MAHPSIAVLITCHNRRSQTCDCLKALKAQGIDCDLYLVDDGSSDGTADAVADCYPGAHIIQGNGNLFWGGGMHLAFGRALEHGYDYYLWLNDDTTLKPKAIKSLLAYHDQLTERGEKRAIVVGATKDPETNEPTYGGAIRSKKWYSNKYEFVSPGNVLKACETMYGNCVLIPKAVSDRVGNIDKNFIHSLGDLDYGLRATRAGCSVWLAPDYMGECSQNDVSGSWVDTDLTPIERLQKVSNIKNFPLKPWTTFVKRHSGPFWFAYWFLPYIRAIIGYQNLDDSPKFAKRSGTKPQS